MKITSSYGLTATIKTISAGHGHIAEGENHPPADIIREYDGLWYAAWFDTPRWHNLKNGWYVGSGFRTRAEAAEWLLDGGR